ncbi:MAG: ion channel [Acidobacteriota bacterium]|nr:ion channel [Acidobacteriota bacterium]
MDKPNFDPGLTQQYTSALNRAINKNGNFNVRRGGTTWRDMHVYLYLISSPWHTFLGLVIAGFMIVNLLFAGLYAAVGIQHLKGANAPTASGRFLNAFFFSTHTLTTVGYGNIYPEGVAANTAAAVEAFAGLMAFAVATGLLVGRVSRPSARIGFSDKMIVAAYQDRTSLQFRIVNRRLSNLMELQARVLLMTVEGLGGKLQRQYKELKLERDQVMFFPLTWTVVHPIDPDSPLFGLTAADLERLQAEALILIKGIDDTFSQTVHVRYSYRYDEIEWGAKFAPAFEVDSDGDLRLEVNKVSALMQAR